VLAQRLQQLANHCPHAPLEQAAREALHDLGLWLVELENQVA